MYSFGTPYTFRPISIFSGPQFEKTGLEDL